MSVERQEPLPHIGSVYVDPEITENVTNSKSKCDSGLGMVDSSSSTSGSSDSEGSSLENSDDNHKDKLPDESNEKVRVSSILDPITSPLNDDKAAGMLDCAEKPIVNIVDVENISENTVVIKDLNLDIVPQENVNTNSKSTSELPLSGLDQDLAVYPPTHSIADVMKKKPLTLSTVSLNEEGSNNNTGMSNSTHSKSAENVTTVETDKHQQTQKQSSSNDLNTDQILSQFSSQKTKVSATQKLVPEATQTNLDLRYTRLPKELLQQADLGSIVKNVHGIFSSVSGSLKNAYSVTNRSAAAKPMKTNPPNPSSKVMNEIFGDETVGPKVVLQTTNIAERSIENLDTAAMVNTESTKECDQDLAEPESDAKKDVLKLQVESLERVLAEQRRENSSLRERFKQQEDVLQQKDHMLKDLEIKMDLMCKRVEQAERDKDAAVMRYASVECAGIEARRAAERAAAAQRAAQAEADLLSNKLKSAFAEKQRICQLYDDKNHELLSSEREAARLREELRELEGRLKWTQSKLRAEMDAYKESAERAEKLSQQLHELEAAATDSVEAQRAKRAEGELKECQAALILCRHERAELERAQAGAAAALEAARRDLAAAAADRDQARDEVDRLRAANEQLEAEAAELAALRAQAALAGALAAQAKRDAARAAAAERELRDERARAAAAAEREAAALQHAADLTHHHVQHRAAADQARDTAQALSADNASLRARGAALEAEAARLRAAAAGEAERRARETRALAMKVAELTEEVAEANKKLEWEKGEVGVLKKKHASAVKELNRELQRALKRCEQLEARLPPPAARAGSVTSLSSGESAAAEREDGPRPAHPAHPARPDRLPDVQGASGADGGGGGGGGGPGPDRQALIERIVSLQRAAARRAERCDFLEEHGRVLTAELRNKTRLLRHLLCAQPAGALADSHRDDNKKQIAMLGEGAMAALWGAGGEGLSPQLSREVAARLQAVLEDALLKNITLKENIDTLGKEIARLKQQKGSSDAT